jgi:hypothetical protein
MVEQGQHAGVLEKPVGRVHEQQVDVVLPREPRHVDPRRDRREHCGPCLDPIAHARRAELVDARADRPQVGG